MTGYFAQLERELAAAAGRQPVRRRARRVVLLAAAALVLAGVPAAAVTGVVGIDRDRDDADRLFDREPVAEGVTPKGARWQLLASHESGRFCVGIALPSGDPDQLSPGGGVTCDHREPGELTIYAAYSQPGILSRGRPRHSVVAGTAPDAAVTVEISAGGAKLTTRTFDDADGIEGRFYATGVPLRWQRMRRHVRAYDARGKVVARAGG